MERLPADQLPRLADYLTLLEAAVSRDTPRPLPKSDSVRVSAAAPDWPHAPLHRVSNHGTFIVTGSTLHKQPLFRGREALELLHDSLLKLAKQHGWTLEAWAVFPNHYHFVAHGGEAASKLDDFLTHVHADTARDLNEAQSKPGRQVWFNFWETGLTYEKSYLARLAYVHQNPVRHGLVPVANQYRWCSAAWFERTATAAQVKTIYGFKIDRVKVRDDYEVAIEDVAAG
ncbi:MAG: transposase [Planctomycetota bacterium]|nr:transposase [Planctomycetota bacterium]